jgi:hypothetical protein
MDQLEHRKGSRRALTSFTTSDAVGPIDSLLYLTMIESRRRNGHCSTAVSVSAYGEEAEAVMPMRQRVAATWAGERLSRCPAHAALCAS